MQLNLGSILQASAEARPDRVAIRLGEQSLRYRDLDRAARGVAAGLRARGFVPGDRVCLLVPNVPDFTIAYFGILYAGCTVVPLNVLCAAPEVTYFLQDSEARLLIAHPLFEAPARAGAEAAGVSVLWAGKSGEGSLAELAAAPPVAALQPTLPSDTAVILYTSGTTGEPKGAELSHSNMFLNAQFSAAAGPVFGP